MVKNCMQTYGCPTQTTQNDPPLLHAGLRLLLSRPDNENMVLAARCLHLHSSSAEQVWRQSHFKIAPPTIWQQWACPTALPSLDVLAHAGMRGMPLKGEPKAVLHNRKCPNSCQQHFLGTPITITAFTLNRFTASPIGNSPNPSLGQSHQWRQCLSNTSKTVAMRRSSRCVREACEPCFVVVLRF
jgi:hypothetical protein